jgi:hypothetical protein
MTGGGAEKTGGLTHTGPGTPMHSGDGEIAVTGCHSIVAVPFELSPPSAFISSFRSGHCLTGCVRLSCAETASSP